MSWSRWRKEYLPLLQTRRKWHYDSPDIKPGDIILLKEDELCRNQWPVGIVTRSFQGEDNHVRKVEVRVGSKLYIRPVVKLILLLREDEL